ncbi:hypothetical protein CND03920 [Cryptococcus gattii WM276]|uniref:Ser-Thr-rich glycosyl-phosphatidyl-inositol-anchored membrane family-domain-containing protein n=2 Tax=Cryptococcus gattii TaxID=37769 RepID=E6R4G6_CRYGW|nr:uncharacterized protein CGB_D6630C [Cryptococcus gattii WM276]ADV21961.1 hypothetical protein CND03920 [Cryptococcus gattii WM276]KIR80891.1 hypothetical protein I306_02348 [Cryptococcus gattii EJB2]KJD99942.1 hypothetical protein I311_06467 [Cryptococcus gattii NT-10]
MNFKTLFATIALLATAWAEDLTVNSPASVVVCQPVALSWSGGTAPYIVAVIPGGQSSAAALETISDNESGNQVTWKVDIDAGTSITFKITDASGSIQYSSPVTIQDGDSSCVNSSASNSTSAASGSSSSGNSSATSSANSTGAAAGGATSGSSSAASGSSNTASASASGSSASSSSAADSTTSASNSAAVPLSVQIPAVGLAVIGGLAALL